MLPPSSVFLRTLAVVISLSRGAPIVDSFPTVHTVHEDQPAASTFSKDEYHSNTTIVFTLNQFYDMGASNLTVGMHTPQKMDMAISPTEPYEEGYIHFYSSVLKVDSSDYRLYYITKGPAGLLSHVAVANSSYGPWRKPNLGIFSYPNSSAVNATKTNNIVAAGVLVSVFLTNSQSEEEKFGAIVGDGLGAAVLYSTDGFHWPTAKSPVSVPVGWDHIADTQPVMFWDPLEQTYIATGRIDGPDKHVLECVATPPYHGAVPGPGASRNRRVGIAVSPTISSGSFGNDDLALGLTYSADDDACTDLYDSQTVRYENLLLMFPSAYHHWRHTDPPNAPTGSAGKGNDGILETYLAASDATMPHAFSFVGNGTTVPWLSRGDGTFDNATWRFSGDFDAGHVFITRGLLQGYSPDGKRDGAGAEWNTIVMYHHGSQLTHGGVDFWWYDHYHGDQPILSGIQRLELRRDGFASLQVQQGMAMGTVTTKSFVVNACDPNDELLLLVNVDTMGSQSRACIGVHTTTDPSPFGVDQCDAIAATDSVRHIVTWNGGTVQDLTRLARHNVSLVVQLHGHALLYAWELRCAPK
eukprot:m.474977 g.474977  ORF g.474977 m.474977 type:complete len:582 (+) comp21686_c0_seq1:27-1772(+)